MRKSLSFMSCLILFLLLPAAVSAHDGHAHGFGQGFAHPFTGIDHLLAMLAVGWWSASSLTGRWWLVPAIFAAMLLAGALFAMNVSIATIAIEVVVAVSLLMLGTLLFARARLSLVAAALIAAALAAAHGMAHGSELPTSAAAQSWLAGMVSATLALHVAGAAIGRATQRRSPWLARTGGVAVAGAGAALFVALMLS
jgi:urease accessory protein